MTPERLREIIALTYNARNGPYAVRLGNEVDIADAGGESLGGTCDADTWRFIEQSEPIVLELLDEVESLRARVAELEGWVVESVRMAANPAEGWHLYVGQVHEDDRQDGGNGAITYWDVYGPGEPPYWHGKAATVEEARRAAMGAYLAATGQQVAQPTLEVKP